MNTQYKKLRDWLDTLNDNEFEDAVNTLLKVKERNAISDLNKVTFLGTMQTWQRLDEVEQHLLETYPERFEEKIELSELVPFVNQEGIISNIMSGETPYHMLAAPAGYGKTTLLHELKRRLEKDSWCVYISTSQDKTIRGLINALFREFDLDMPTLTENEPISPAILEGVIGELGYLLKDKIPKEKKGYVIFIDIEKVNRDDIKNLINDIGIIIGTLFHGLKMDSRFKNQTNPLRIIIAGRYLTEDEIPQSEKPRFSIHQLELFSYHVLFKWLSSPRLDLLYEGNSIESIEQLSAHIKYLSGGHPGTVDTLLKRYKKVSGKPDNFLAYSGKEIKQILQKQANQVINDISPKFRDTLKKLSPCRRITIKFLERFMIEGFIENTDSYTLADELTISYLMTRENGFLQDGVTRGLLAIDLRQTNLKYFLQICQMARQIYADDLSKNNRLPEIVAIELLYQDLQLGYYQLSADTTKEREELATTFFDSMLKNCLTALVHRDDPRDIIANFQDALKKDSEFQFTLNYFLRGNLYNEEPYKSLQEYLEKYAQTLR